jgi:hypothetical protein
MPGQRCETRRRQNLIPEELGIDVPLTAFEIVVVLPALSRFGGTATRIV